MKSSLRVVFVVASLLSAVQAQGALFLGNTVRVTHEAPNVGAILEGPVDAVVTDPGVEAQLLSGFVDIDLFDDAIRISVNNPGLSIFFAPASFNGFVINDVLGSLPAFSTVSVNPTSTISGVVTFDANSIYVNFQGVETGFNSPFLLINVSAASTAIIPEPATTSLGLLGLVGLMIRRRRVA